jgi:hypothetical protein
LLVLAPDDAARTGPLGAGGRRPEVPLSRLDVTAVPGGTALAAMLGGAARADVVMPQASAVTTIPVSSMPGARQSRLGGRSGKRASRWLPRTNT